MKHAIALVVLVLFVSGCSTTRSISDSGYDRSHGRSGSGIGLYAGELSEFDILGKAPHADVTQANISKTLEAAVSPKLKRGDKVILIQSGAHVPDNAMLEDAARYFEVAPFSGVPSAEKTPLAETLRLRAAQGGYRFVVCYWGILESAQEDKEGKVVSWIPIVGNFVPDQKQQMRIRLKALAVDVGTGGWKMLTPEAYSDESYNSSWSRETRDQKLVMALKEKGYRSLVADLVKQ